jgi:hypothetical protein
MYLNDSKNEKKSFDFDNLDLAENPFEFEKNVAP